MAQKRCPTEGDLVSNKLFSKSLCKSQFQHESVNLSFTMTNIKNELTDLSGNQLLQEDFTNTFCAIRPADLDADFELGQALHAHVTPRPTSADHFKVENSENGSKRQPPFESPSFNAGDLRASTRISSWARCCMRTSPFPRFAKERSRSIAFRACRRSVLGWWVGREGWVAREVRAVASPPFGRGAWLVQVSHNALRESHMAHT